MHWYKSFFTLLVVGVLSGCLEGGKNPPPDETFPAQTTVSPVSMTPTSATENSPEAQIHPAAPTDTSVPITSTVDLPTAMKSMKILLFEDMIYNRYVKKALDDGGYTYTDSEDAIGWLKDYILSGTNWDLVIIASEGKYTVQGEFFDYIKQLLDQGSSVVTEMWILDWVKDGRIQPILEQCGIRYQSNWVNPSVRGVYWVDLDHPLATEPNAVSLERFRLFWRGDVGDLVRKAPDSTAQIVASAYAPNSEEDGLITICYDGRLIMQTFATHDHFQDEMVKLWQNYVYYALKTRIQATQK